MVFPWSMASPEMESVTGSPALEVGGLDIVVLAPNVRFGVTKLLVRISCASMVNVLVTLSAGEKSGLPAWLAVTETVPGLVNVSVDPERVALWVSPDRT